MGEVSRCGSDDPHVGGVAGFAQAEGEAEVAGHPVAAELGALAQVAGAGQEGTPQLQLGRALLARTRDLGEGAQFRSDWVPGDPSLTFGLRVPGDSADMPVR